MELIYMPYRQRAAPIVDVPGLRWGHAGGFNLEGMIRRKDMRNFTFQLEGGGVLTTKRTLSEDRLTLSKKLSEQQTESMLATLFNGRHTTAEGDSRHGMRLYLSTNLQVDGKTVGCTVTVQAEGNWYKGIPDITLIPVLPEMFGKGEEASNAGGNETRLFEGVDPELNRKALEIARGMRSAFGTTFGKLTADCATKVCVGQVKVSPDDIRAMLSGGNVSLVFETWASGYNGKTIAASSLVYGNGMLEVDGWIYSGKIKDDFPISGMSNTLRAAEIVADTGKNVEFEEKYRREMPRLGKLGSALGAVAGAPLLALKASYRAASRPIKRRLAETARQDRAAKERLFNEVIVQKDEGVQGGFCVVTYDKQCFVDPARQ